MTQGLKIFVVGATGYIGSELHQRARYLGETYGTSNSDKKDFIRFSLNTPAKFDYGRISSGNVVFLAAAISAPDVCAREYSRAWAINVDGTTKFINKAIKRGARVIFFSSDTVYGEHETEFDEKVDCNPSGEYAQMKHEVEQHFYGSPYFKSIRLSYVFSSEDKFTRYLMGCNQRNEKAELFHPFYRAIVHRDDVVDGALALAKSWDDFPENVINFGGPQILSRVEFAECLREVHLKDLQFIVTQPSETFFKNRPRIISMKSPILAKLLGRPPRSVFDAARIEFNLSTIKNL